LSRPPADRPEGLLVEVTRGNLVESFHRVDVCAVDSGGELIVRAGEIDAPVYLRSAAKPFIAAAIVESGAHKKFNFDPREIAVMTGSHSGQPFHLQAVSSILEKIGLDATALRCGAHLPYDEASARALIRAGLEPNALHNNCSGKHAGILALCKTIGVETASYLSAEHPAQQRILAFCARVSDDDAATWPVGVDGCGIPVYATSLRKAALSFARLASLQGLERSDAEALAIVRDAMVAHPEYVAGSGQMDTDLMSAGEGTIVSKAGAEGVHGVGATLPGYGYASKVRDGSSRGRAPSTFAVLRELGVLSEEKAAQLARFGRPSVYNRAGHVVGEIFV
jgi:L-asparaginase II